MLKRSFVIALGLVLGLTLWGANQAQAAANVMFYHGPHPVTKAHGGGFCHKQGIHYHLYKPTDAKQFKVRNDIYYFSNDPVLYGYKKKMHRYFGHHAVSGNHGGGYCNISGQHYHHYKPSKSAISNYKVRKGYYYYTGPYGANYKKGYNVYLHKDSRWRYVSHPLYRKTYVPVNKRSYVTRSRAVRRSVPTRRVVTTTVTRPGRTTTVVTPGARPVRRVVRTH